MLVNGEKIKHFDDPEGIEASGMATTLVKEKVAETLGIDVSKIEVKINDDNPWFALLELERVGSLEFSDVRSVQSLITQPLKDMGIQIQRNSFSSKNFMYYVYCTQSFV